MNIITQEQLETLAERSIRMLAREQAAHAETKRRLEQCIQNTPVFEHVSPICSQAEHVRQWHI